MAEMGRQNRPRGGIQWMTCQNWTRGTVPMADFTEKVLVFRFIFPTSFLWCSQRLLKYGRGILRLLY